MKTHLLQQTVLAAPTGENGQAGASYPAVSAAGARYGQERPRPEQDCATGAEGRRGAPSAANQTRVFQRTLAWLLARKEFGDRFHSGWVLACVLVWLGAIGLTSVFGLLQIGRIGVLGYERTVLSMLNLVQYLVPLLGLLLGHDLIAGEKEERTARLLVASGLSRTTMLLGKLLGGCLTLAVPLLAGFAVAGTVIGLAAKDSALAPFLRLACSGLGLGCVFVALGLTLSCFAKSRVQAIVSALVTWCLFVFVFDLLALGIIVSTQSPAASHEIEMVCDAMHVNAAADIHSEADVITGPARPAKADRAQSGAMLGLALNPIDVFRAVNLGAGFTFRFAAIIAGVSFCSWLLASMLLARWKFNRMDL